ncbi:MAG: FAD-dependent oxidoreductase [Pseudonocardiaceae bacterium]
MHYLRHIENSERLREAIRGGNRVVIVGAGWIGLKSAAAARKCGCESPTQTRVCPVWSP